MLIDIIELFKKHEDIENIVFDNYTPSKGLYIRIKDGKIEQTMTIEKEEPMNNEYEWFKQADYYSSLVDMNKPVDNKKKIHSCNYLSLFVKTDILPDIGTSDKALSIKELEEAISRYFKALADTGNEKNGEMLREFHLPDINGESINKNRDWLLQNFQSIIDLVKGTELPKNSYIKLFFFEDIEKYAIESKRYLIPRIFNKNDYNENINDITMGLSNYNMGMNSKKPYLEHMTTKFKVPFRIGINDAIVLKNIFEWLEGQKNEKGDKINRAYISRNFNFKGSVEKPKDGYYFYYLRGMETMVKDFEYIPRYSNKVEPLDIYDRFELPEWKYSNTLSNMNELEEAIDSIFFGGRLRKNYYTEVKDLPSPSVKSGYSRGLENLLVMYRKSLHDYFYKNCDIEIKSCIDKLSREVVKEYAKTSSGLNFYKACSAFNLRLVLLDYFNVKGEENMGDKIVELSERIRTKMNEKDKIVYCEDDTEFFFATGQLARYMLSQSEAKDLKHSSAETLLRSKNANMIKKKLKDLYFAYGHRISMKGNRFNNIMSMTMGYMSDALMKDYEDYFLAGLMSKSILYEKNEKEGN